MKVIESMFCKYHIKDVRKEVIMDNLMFIDFRKVNALSSEKVFSALHEQHKEEFKKKLSDIDDYAEKISGDTSDVFKPLEPTTDAEKKALDKINKMAGHKK